MNWLRQLRWDYASQLEAPWTLPSVLWALAEATGGLLFLFALVCCGWIAMILVEGLGQ